MVDKTQDNFVIDFIDDTCVDFNIGLTALHEPKTRFFKVNP